MCWCSTWLCSTMRSAMHIAQAGVDPKFFARVLTIDEITSLPKGCEILRVRQLTRASTDDDQLVSKAYGVNMTPATLTYALISMPDDKRINALQRVKNAEAELALAREELTSTHMVLD